MSHESTHDTEPRSPIRVSLRPIGLGDAEALQALERDPEVGGFVGTSSGPRAEARLRSEVERWGATGWGIFAIIGSDPASFIGIAGFIPSKAVDGAPELICAILPAYRRMGVAADACGQAIHWGFERHGWPQVVAVVAQKNAPALRLVPHLGMSAIGERTDFIDGLQTVFSRSQPAT